LAACPKKTAVKLARFSQSPFVIVQLQNFGYNWVKKEGKKSIGGLRPRQNQLRSIGNDRKPKTANASLFLTRKKDHISRKTNISQKLSASMQQGGKKKVPSFP